MAPTPPTPEKGSIRQAAAERNSEWIPIDCEVADIPGLDLKRVSVGSASDVTNPDPSYQDGHGHAKVYIYPVVRTANGEPKLSIRPIVYAMSPRREKYIEVQRSATDHTIWYEPYMALRSFQGITKERANAQKEYLLFLWEKVSGERLEKVFKLHRQEKASKAKRLADVAANTTSIEEDDGDDQLVKQDDQEEDSTSSKRKRSTTPTKGTPSSQQLGSGILPDRMARATLEAEEFFPKANDAMSFLQAKRVKLSGRDHLETGNEATRFSVAEPRRTFSQTVATGGSHHLSADVKQPLKPPAATQAVKDGSNGTEAYHQGRSLVDLTGDDDQEMVEKVLHTTSAKKGSSSSEDMQAESLISRLEAFIRPKLPETLEQAQKVFEQCEEQGIDANHASWWENEVVRAARRIIAKSRGKEHDKVVFKF